MLFRSLGGNRTLNFTNAKPGASYILQVVQDGTGSRTLTWDANIEWAGGVAPTLSAGAGADDIFTFVSFDTITLKGVTAGLDFS